MNCPWCGGPGEALMVSFRCSTEGCRNYSPLEGKPIETTNQGEQFKVGDRVILGKHDLIPNHEDWGLNWNGDMNQYVGKTGTIVLFNAPYSPAVTVRVKEWPFWWRVRNLKRAKG